MLDSLINPLNKKNYHYENKGPDKNTRERFSENHEHLRYLIIYVLTLWVLRDDIWIAIGLLAVFAWLLYVAKKKQSFFLYILTLLLACSVPPLVAGHLWPLVIYGPMILFLLWLWLQDKEEQAHEEVDANRRQHEASFVTAAIDSCISVETEARHQSYVKAKYFEFSGVEQCVIITGLLHVRIAAVRHCLDRCLDEQQAIILGSRIVQYCGHFLSEFSDDKSRNLIKKNTHVNLCFLNQYCGPCYTTKRKRPTPYVKGD